MRNQMFRRKIRGAQIISVAVLVVLAGSILLSLGGCAGIDAWIAKVQGQLVGESFNIQFISHYGEVTAQVSGRKVAMEGVEDTGGALSSVVKLTIDGSEMKTVGDSMVAIEKGITLWDYTPEYMDVQTSGSSLGLIPIDRFLNNLKNEFGKAKVVVIKSQLGLPLYVIEGDSVYDKVPDDLPKTTRIVVDGKSVYLHRVNYQIYDVKLLG